ncbi:MAG TPA: HAD-IIA family hydrolase [Bacillus bacterium]|uniref:Acid sugar phosphatase n=1 Tax=Siminovitchia fordii TaxID=254759 RepID=A0ABQ4K155_9BACI|nr:HAD-IIA family hydrolase [Siminovitchia fordii]GIN19493.1 acid sugar phosphatase [Siminovitchia fordii]HBZ11637.1 HAD-IIA family hydrolase [Bacillus sp. (in: firmicutes)]
MNIDDFEAYCFDLDGTIYLGNQILPGAKETLETLRMNHKKVLFITNSPTQTREECRRRLESLGIDVCSNEILTGPFISALYFSENFPDALIYVVGEEAIRTEFNHFSLKVTEDPSEATHVLVGLDRSFTYEKLNMAMNAVRNGAKLIVTNPDPTCPVPGGFVSDTYAIARAIEVASGKSIFQVTGKPSAFYGERILKELNVESDQCLIVGDRLETDILLGKFSKIRTCLVLTGVARKEDVDKTKIYPDFIIKDLNSLFFKVKQPC